MSVFPVPGKAFRALASLLGPGGAKSVTKAAQPAAKAAQFAKHAGLDFSNPTNALGLGVPTALLGVSLAQGIGGSIKESLVGMDRDIEQEIRARRYEAAQAMKAQRLKQAMAENMTRLAAANPQLYNQLMVGRRLPQGAVVLGGGQRSDFLESVAYQMATGGFETPTSSTDPLKAIVDSY